MNGIYTLFIYVGAFDLTTAYAHLVNHDDIIACLEQGKVKSHSRNIIINKWLYTTW